MSHTITVGALEMLLSSHHSRKGICTRSEALEFLEISESYFKELLRHPESRIRPSKVHGKYILSSLREEYKRIHGVSKEEATGSPRR
ncbi:hypothetical protein [Robiginitalea biformata]|uniref:hypothetical protein n=1 Tax=Robiginitalea biformata TaxID=252307 RepID=UPI0003245802|nr:hypothetical protein [Robiginitalea biformata]